MWTHWGSFVVDAVTNYCRLGGLKQQMCSLIEIRSLSVEVVRRLMLPSEAWGESVPAFFWWRQVSLGLRPIPVVSASVFTSPFLCMYFHYLIACICLPVLRQC